VNLELALGVAVSTTSAPSSKSAEQVCAQLIPGGADATVPEPVPVIPTFSRWLIVPLRLKI
jgi:hypothetical protein